MWLCVGFRASVLGLGLKIWSLSLGPVCVGGILGGFGDLLRRNLSISSIIPIA